MKTLSLVAYLLCFAATLANAENVQVKVKDSAIRAACRFYAPVKAKVRFGDQLAVSSRSGDWYLVSFRGAYGCIHRGAVESRTFTVSGSGGGQAGVSRDEVSLAGKGFNPQVERSYRTDNPSLNFAAVDSLEKVVVDEDQLRVFIERGGLKLP